MCTDDSSLGVFAGTVEEALVDGRECEIAVVACAYASAKKGELHLRGTEPLEFDFFPALFPTLPPPSPT